MEKTYDVIVVGAGTSGMMAAITAAKQGARVLLIEKVISCITLPRRNMTACMFFYPSSCCAYSRSFSNGKHP